MGYTTTFDGSVKIEPPLNQEEIQFLQKFNETRRMNRANGPYFVDGSGFMGQDHDPDVRDHNRPPEGQPGLWCQWTVNDEGTEIEWDEGEKFYDADLWMTYIIEHFLKPNPIAKSQLPFLQGHICNGVVDAQGEDSDDRWRLVVIDNKVEKKFPTITWE